MNSLSLRDQSFCAEILDCHRCPARQFVKIPILGEGPQDAKVIWVGRDPGAEEVIQNRPFVGRAGILLDEIIVALGLSRSEVGVINSKKCAPPGNTPPTLEELESCKHWLKMELGFFNHARVIIPLGNEAMRVLLGQNTPSITSSILKFSKVCETDQYIVPMFHPSFLLRQQDWKQWTFSVAIPKIRKFLISKKVFEGI